MDSSVIIAFLITFIAGISTCAGIIFTFIRVKRVEEFIVFCLGLSLSVMITICITDLLPKSLFDIFYNEINIMNIVIVLFLFILGIMTINFINKKIIKENNNKNNLKNLGILSILAIFMHNLPEGIATFMSSYSSIKLGLILSFGIMLHNIPEGILIALPLFQGGVKRSRVVLYTLIAGLSELLGAFITYIFLKSYINDYLISIILIYVSGLMMCLSINYVYKEALEYNRNKYLYLGMITGVCIYILSSIILNIVIT